MSDIEELYRRIVTKVEICIDLLSTTLKDIELLHLAEKEQKEHGP